MCSADRRSKLFGLFLAMSALVVLSAGPASAEQLEWVCVGGPTPNPICVQV